MLNIHIVHVRVFCFLYGNFLCSLHNLSAYEVNLLVSEADTTRQLEEVARLQRVLEAKHADIAELQSKNNEILEQRKRVRISLCVIDAEHTFKLCLFTRLVVVT